MHSDELDQSLVSNIVSSVGKYYPPTSPSLSSQQHNKAAFQVPNQPRLNLSHRATLININYLIFFSSLRIIKDYFLRMYKTSEPWNI